MTLVQFNSSVAKAKQAFLKTIKERFFLRFHMSLILVATILSGLLATKLLLLHLNNIIIRYPLAVLYSYLAFFLFVKLWLSYLTASKSSGGSGSTTDLLSGLPDISCDIGKAAETLPSFSGGGGLSGGGGATAGFDGPVSAVQEGFIASSPAPSSGSAGGGGGVGLDLGDGDGIVLIALGLLLAAIFGSAIYLVYDAPNLLSDAAFNFLLASGLVRSYKRVIAPDWMGSVFHATYKPFLVVMVVSGLAAWIIHAHYPQVTKITELIPIFSSTAQ